MSLDTSKNQSMKLFSGKASWGQLEEATAVQYWVPKVTGWCRPH